MLSVQSSASELPKFWAATFCPKPDFLSYERGNCHNSLLWLQPAFFFRALAVFWYFNFSHQWVWTKVWVFFFFVVIFVSLYVCCRIMSVSKKSSSTLYSKYVLRQEAVSACCLLCITFSLELWRNPTVFRKLCHCTETQFASFNSGGFTTVAVINPPDWKLANHTYHNGFCQYCPTLAKSRNFMYLEKL